MLRIMFTSILIVGVFSLVSVTSSYHQHIINESRLTVTIPWSTIVGKQEQVLGKSIGVFLGLPYAKPPVGQLRFSRPLSLDPVNRDEGVYDATSFRSPCPQPPYNNIFNNTSENCLFLNIWTPVIGSPLTSNDFDSSSSLKPVLFYIYGGGFDKGSVHERRHHGDILSSLSDTVVVTVNHRLDILGFAYGGTESMPGNMGIYDLIKALEWVNQNIEYFGGDPKGVTVFGACSGAMAASGFILSPTVDKNIISKIYLASSVVSPNTAVKSPEKIFKITRKVAESLGCGNADEPEAKKLTEQQINCLKTIDAQRLVNASFTDEIRDQLSSPVAPPYAMIHGTDFLPVPPDHLVLDQFPHRRIPILFGNEQAEDEIFTDSWPGTKQEAKDLLSSLLFKSLNVTNKQLDSIFQYYFDRVEENNILEIKQALTSAAGDYLHHCPLLLFTESWTRNGQIIHGYLNAYVMDGFNKTERLFGTKHGDTAFQLLGQAYHEYDKFSDRDRSVTKKMIKILKDFAYGRKLNWPPMLLDSSRAVLPLKRRLTKTMSSKNIFSDPKDDICHLWGEIRGMVVY